MASPHTPSPQKETPGPPQDQGGAQPKERTRSYFCRPCGIKHTCPTNAKCTRRRPDRDHDEAESHRDDPDTSVRTRRAKAPAKPTTSRRKSATTKRKRTDVVSESSSGDESLSTSGQCQNDSDNNNQLVSMNFILNRIEALSSEGRAERDRMAEQSKKDRAYFRSALAAIQPDVLSDDDSPSVGMSNGVTGSRGPHVGQPVPTGRNSIQQLRSDETSARLAAETLQKYGPTVDETTKRLKSGYNMTINDHATVIAQWPQLNVYRAPNDTATYDSLSVEEFCNGYLMYIQDCLLAPKPDIFSALDYLDYLKRLIG